MSAAARKRTLLTLGEIARRTNISMATAQRYKKLHQDRIPSEGEGRKQRYPVAAVKIFKELKKERASNRRGAGRKKAPRRPPKAAAPAASLLTLTNIGQQTGISYPTLQRYVRLFGDRIPHEGDGRKRRYHPDSVAVFRQLRAESKPGRKPKAKVGAEAARAPARKERKARAKVASRTAAAPKLLTLTAIGQQTGISSPTLQRYVKLHGDRIPHEGEGRKRRYHPEAVAVFREIRSKSKRGRKPKAKVAPAPAPARKKRKARVAKARGRAATTAAASRGSVEARLAALEAQVSQVLKKLEQPITITLRR